MKVKPPPIKRDICGQRSGWNAHNRHGERQCDPCKKAQAEYMRDYRHRVGLTRSTLFTPQQVEEIKQHAVADAIRAAHAKQLPRHARRLLIGRRK